MKQVVLILAVASLLFLYAGCVTPSGAPITGMLITTSLKGPVAMGDSGVKPEKTGTAEAEGIVFFASGDASIEAAMKAGDIKEVHHVDCEVFSILGIYTKWTTIVYGE